VEKTLFGLPGALDLFVSLLHVRQLGLRHRVSHWAGAAPKDGSRVGSSYDYRLSLQRTTIKGKPMKKHGLTAKQRLFTLEYLKDFNATQAAIRAGYSAKTAAPAASRLLTNVKVSAEIQKAMRRRVDRLDLHAHRVLREIADHASANICDYLEIDDRGKVKLNLSMLTRDSAKGLAKYRITKDGFSITLTNRLKALALLGKHLGLFVEGHEHDLPLTQGIAELGKFLGLDKMSDEELDEARKFLDERSEPSRLGPQPDNGREIVIKRKRAAHYTTRVDLPDPAQA